MTSYPAVAVPGTVTAGVQVPGTGVPRVLRTLTAVTVASVWALVIVGGIVRVTGSGLGCPDWPLCTSTALPLPSVESVIEYSHRVVVAWVSVMVVAVVVIAWRKARHRKDILVPAIIALVLLPVQALLGAFAIWFDLHGAMVAVHFMTGMTFLAVNAITMANTWRAPGTVPATRAYVWLARLAALVGLALITLGASVVATSAAAACGTDWPACNGGFASGGGLAALQVTHRMFGYGLAILAIVLAVMSLRGKGPRALGALLLVVVLIQISFGVWIVVSYATYPVYASFSAAHVAGAGFVWGLVIVLATVVHRTAPRSSSPSPPLEPVV